ncbi:unnamed protein product [Linum tenue]|uniref:F-box domain-containing protein n=1 Tax=Linum tenue TaxID=586396 RepID=A0AAV0NJD9_9ROSI|nr:unnamed protein product [Linum tenue]
MKRVCESSADRITDLPADVIQRILVFLPIKDAAKTSILSRKWRHQWLSIPQLVFDNGFAQLKSDFEARSKLIMLSVYRTLLVHDGPITKFELSVLGLEFCDEIEHIVRYLSSKGVQDLKLSCSSPNPSTGGYKIHTSLFSALNLKSLNLNSCVFTPPTWFVGFSKLTNLKLVDAALPDGFFVDFLPKCPMLECLEVIECSGHSDKLEIAAPFLKSFNLEAYFMEICFKHAPLLSVVALHLSEADTPDMVPLFASLPALQEFHVNYDFLRFLAHGDGETTDSSLLKHVPARLPTTLHQLTVLHMTDLVFDNSEMERVFVCLIMSSPNLRSLTVQRFSIEEYYQPANDEVSSIRRLLEAEDCLACLQHLREFTILQSLGAQVEMDLVRFVLATAPLVRFIHIMPIHNFDPKREKDFMRELMRYKRVSKEAEIIYNRVDEY